MEGDKFNKAQYINELKDRMEKQLCATSFGVHDGCAHCWCNISLKVSAYDEMFMELKPDVIRQFSEIVLVRGLQQSSWCCRFTMESGVAVHCSDTSYTKLSFVSQTCM